MTHDYTPEDVEGGEELTESQNASLCDQSGAVLDRTRENQELGFSGVLP